MTELDGLNVLFIAGFGPLVRDQDNSARLYIDTLGLPLSARPENPTYLHTDKLQGVRYFALWPLTQAARSCFDTDVWPDDVATPQAWLEFEVEDIATATEVLKARGYRLLVDARREPWGQTVSRLLGPEGMLLAISHTPWLRN